MKKNIIVLMIIALITKSIGFGKQMILAYLFGASNRFIHLIKEDFEIL